MDRSVVSFVLRAAQPRFFGPSAETLPQPENVTDVSFWDGCFEFADRLGILLPFSASLKQSSLLKELPTSVEKRLEKTLKNELIAMAVLENEFEQILKHLVHTEIPIVVLAGSYLGKGAEELQSLRSVRALELLLVKDQLAAALRIVGKMGYRSEGTSGPLGGMLLTRKLPNLVAGRTIVSHLRLRWRVLEMDAEHDAAAIWDRTVALTSPEFPKGLRALSDEDKVLQLIRQGAVESLLDSPIWLNELDSLVRHSPQLDWAKVIHLLGRSKCVSAGAFVLGYLHRAWKTPIPVETVQQLHRKVSALKRRAMLTHSDPENWFSQERDTGFFMRALYLFRDQTGRAIRDGLSYRQKKKA